MMSGGNKNTFCCRLSRQVRVAREQAPGQRKNEFAPP